MSTHFRVHTRIPGRTFASSAALLLLLLLLLAFDPLVLPAVSWPRVALSILCACLNLGEEAFDPSIVLLRPTTGFALPTLIIAPASHNPLALAIPPDMHLLNTIIALPQPPRRNPSTLVTHLLGPFLQRLASMEIHAVIRADDRDQPRLGFHLGPDTFQLRQRTHAVAVPGDEEHTRLGRQCQQDRVSEVALGLSHERVRCKHQ